jgi:hypothetical protein
MKLFEKHRSKMAHFITKHMVFYSGCALILQIIAIPISLAVFPDGNAAIFVLVALAGVSSALADFAGNIVDAEQNAKAPETPDVD